MATSEDGASSNERLLAAARSDNDEMLLEALGEDDCDINFQDGLGNTALHYAASRGSTDVLEHILTTENCDVDPVNRLEGQTPLHYAVQLEDEDVRKYIVGSLLDAGADTSIKDKSGCIALDYVKSSDVEVQTLFKSAATQNALDAEIVPEEFEDSDGPPSDDD